MTIDESLELSNRFVDLLAERIDLAIRFSTEPLASAFLASRDSRWVTGRTLLTDGGRM